MNQVIEKEVGSNLISSPWLISQTIWQNKTGVWDVLDSRVYFSTGLEFVSERYVKQNIFKGCGKEQSENCQ